MNSTPAYNSQEYLAHIAQVNLINNLYDGVDSVTQHLTKFPRESDAVYLDRQSKAVLKNFISRVANSTRNLLVAKPPILDINPALESNLLKIDRKNSLDTFIRQVALNKILDGFTFVVIDAPRVDESIQTLADQLQNDIEPYMYTVRRSQVTNWKEKSDGTFVRITIKEIYEKTVNRYDSEYDYQYRTYFEDGTVEVWRDNKLHEVIELGVDFVPVVKVGAFDVPLLYDIAKLNINHFNRRSNLDRYLQIAALPVPVIYGNTSDGNIVIGVDDALSFSDKNESGFEWVELTGSSIESLQNDLLTLEEAILQEAVTLTSNDITVAKNETQVASENAEGFGKLNHIAVELEKGLNTALSYLGKFKSIDDVGTIELDKDFKSSKLTSDEVKDIIALYTSGIISLDTALTKLLEGQVVEVEDIETEKAKVNDLS